MLESLQLPMVLQLLRSSQLQRSDTFIQMAGPSRPGKNIPPHLIRSMCRRVRMSRAQLTVQQLKGITINDSFGSLRTFKLSETKWFATLVERHNDTNDDYHLDMFETVVIGRDLQAEWNIVHLNMTSLWFLYNVLQAMEYGWIFQLNGDATFNFCRRVVDMISCAPRLPRAHNHALCWSHCKINGIY